MAKFSPAEAVFSGFRFVKERPATIMVWSAYLLVVLLVASMAVHDIGGDSLNALSQAAGRTPPSPQQSLKLVQDVLPALLFGGLLMTVFSAVLSAAILRVRLKPAPHPWGGLRLGNDELHLLGAKLLVMVALLAAEILIFFAAAVLVRIGVPPLVSLVLCLAPFAAVMVRLSLAGVVSQTEGKVSPLRSLQLTGPLFWPLLGAYVLLGAIMLVLVVLVNMIFAALMGAASLAGGGKVDQTALAVIHGSLTDLNPMAIAVYVLSSLVQVWVAVAATAVFLSIASDAYKAATSTDS